MPEVGDTLDLRGAHVAILGWAGSTERQLRGVVRWYAARGGRPFTARARVFRNMARPDGWRLEGRELAPRIRARLSRDDAPLVVHLFSNAGFWTYAAAWRELPPADRARLSAVIMDSAPGFPEHIEPRFYADNAAKAMMPMLLRALGKPPALRHPLLTPPVWAFMRLWYHASPIQQREAETSLALAREPRCPHLFLYSSTDELVPAELVERFIQTLPPALVTAHRWTDSPHVLHMVKHRADYFARLAAFLADLG